MSNKDLAKRTEKFVFVIETDPERQAEIKEALSHQEMWKILFFSSPESCIQALDKRPMVIFLDIEHFSADNNLDKGYALIAELRSKSHISEVIVFTESENEEQAAMVLKKGAMDYIVINEHQFAKMENELIWIEKVFDQRIEDRRQNWFSMVLVGFIVLVIVVFLGLYFFKTAY